MSRIVILIVAVVLAGAVWAGAGVVVLKDGTRLEGKIRATPGGFAVIDAGGKETVVAAGDVASMQPDKSGAAAGGAGAAAGGGEAGAGDIATLRRAVSTLRDPKQAVEKYKAFLARNPAGPTKAEAEKDLAVWQDRADRGLAKVGEDWITAAEAGERRQRAAAVAGGVGSLVAQGNFAGAEAAVDAALKMAPNNPSLQFFKGVILFHKNQLVPARKAFEQAEAGQPESWAVHNNLAVILFQTRSQMPAMAQYEKAMSADPGNQRVLDNVAEALHQLPPASMKNELVRKVAAKFMEQDTLLAAKMKQDKGLMRVGALWVPAEEYATLQAARKDAEEKIAEYRKEGTDLPSEINRMDQDLTIKTNAMKAMVQESAGIDAYGNIIYSALPQHYYQLKQEVEQMTGQRVLKERRLEQLPHLMDEAQKQLAGTQARFSGKQVMVEDIAPAGGTQPSTRPG